MSAHSEDCQCPKRPYTGEVWDEFYALIVKHYPEAKKAQEVVITMKPGNHIDVIVTNRIAPPYEGNDAG